MTARLVMVLTLTVALVGDGFLLGAATRVAAQSSSGTISGTVTADRGVVQAFRVRARDTVHKIIYTVFTVKGRYQIFNLPSSTYDVQVYEDGFESPVQRVDVRAGATATANLALKAKPMPPEEYERVEFDVVYAPGPGRDLFVRRCMSCHNYTGGDHYLGGYRTALAKRGGETEAQWRAAYSRMYRPTGERPRMENPDPPEEIDAIMKYLATALPPGHKKRDVKLDLVVRDEAELAQAVYVQYEDVGEFGLGVSPSAAKPGIVWMGAPGVVKALDTRILDPTKRLRQWPIVDPGEKILGLAPGTLDTRQHDLIEHNGKVIICEMATSALLVFDPDTGKYERHYVPGQAQHVQTHTPYADSKGNIWFNSKKGPARIYKLDMATKKITEYNPLKGANWYALVVDAKDRVWATPYSVNGIVMYDPKTDKWTTYPTSYPQRRIALDRDGRIWSTQYFGNAVTRVDPNTGQVEEIPLPLKNGNPYEIFADPQGNIWVENERYQIFMKADPTGRNWTYYPFPSIGHTPKIEIDADGTMWFSGLLQGGFNPLVTSLKPNGNVKR